MRVAGVEGAHRRRRGKYVRRPLSTATAPDMVERQFTASKPNKLWVADITYLRSREGFLSLAVVIDACSRKVVGWAMADHLRTELVLDAFGMAIFTRKPDPGLIRHNDRGSQGGFNGSSQHLSGFGGVRRWRRRTGARRPAMCPRARVGSGAQIGRCARRCAHPGDLIPHGRCSASSGD